MTGSIDPVETVTRLYQTLLGRMPEPAGLDYWSQKIVNGTSISEVYSGIRYSSEGRAWHSNAEQSRAGDFVDSLYVSYLYRRAEPEARDAWVAKIHSGEMKYDDVSNAVFSSDERVNKSGMEKIIGLYQGLLGRGPDALGLRGWFDEYKAGQATIAEIAELIRNSDEGQLKLPKTMDDISAINTISKRLYSRDADPVELDRISHRLKSGESIADIVVEMSTYEAILDSADLNTIRAKNMYAYSLVRDEFKSLALDNQTSYGNYLLMQVTPEYSIIGTAGPDRLVGTIDDELIMGRSGDDTIEGGGGQDELIGEAGNDTIFGGPDIDLSIDGNEGDDTIYVDGGASIRTFGGAGDDHIYMSRSARGVPGSTVDGGDGNDIFHYSVYDWQNNRDAVNGGGGRDGIVFNVIDQDFSFYKDNIQNIEWINLSTGMYGNLQTYSLYINPGVDIGEIHNLHNASFKINPFELKILPLSTPFNAEPVFAWGNYDPGKYNPMYGTPLDDINSPGEWWLYRDVAGNGYITYWDEALNYQVTTTLVDAAYKGGVEGGVIIVNGGLW